MTKEEVLDKIAQIAIDNDVNGYVRSHSSHQDLFFYQQTRTPLSTKDIIIRIPWEEIADQAWPIIEARLKFYGKCNKKAAVK